MGPNRKLLLGLITCGTLVLTAGAHAVITVASTVDQVGSTIRTQGVIKNPTSIAGGGTNQFAVAIKEITGNLQIRDSITVGQGLNVVKRQLTPAETWGQGLAQGYQQPPFTDPEGPWFGLVWPYRDQYDYFPDKGDPLGDDVGTFFEDGPIYGFSNVIGHARGGPTDDVPPPGMNTPDWLNRGITGNGLQGPATYFMFDVIPAFGDPTRPVDIRIFNASAVVVQRDNFGNYSEIVVPIPNFETTVRLPEPATAVLAAIGACALALRPRRRQIESFPRGLRRHFPR
jgi:hypothetical protein